MCSMMTSLKDRSSFCFLLKIRLGIFQTISKFYEDDSTIYGETHKTLVVWSLEADFSSDLPLTARNWKRSLNFQYVKTQANIMFSQHIRVSLVLNRMNGCILNYTLPLNVYIIPSVKRTCYIQCFAGKTSAHPITR